MNANTLKAVKKEYLFQKICQRKLTAELERLIRSRAPVKEIMQCRRCLAECENDIRLLAMVYNPKN